MVLGAGMIGGACTRAPSRDEGVAKADEELGTSTLTVPLERVPADLGPAASVQAAPPIAEPREAPRQPKTFFEATASFHQNATPTSGASTLAWKHYKAEEFEEAQRHFVLASLFEPTHWKHPFNLACASAMAADEDMTRIALAEAVARDPVRAAAKARKDSDLQEVRELEWFEPTLRGTVGAGEPLPDEDDVAPSEPLSAGGAVYIALDAGPKGSGGLARLDRSGRWSLAHDSAARLVRDPTGRLYVSSSDRNDVSRIEPLEGGASLTVPSSLSWVTGFAAAGEGTFWVTGMRGLAFYDGTSWMTVASEETLGKGRLYPTNVMVTPDGAVWVTNNRELYSVKDELLSEVALPGPEDRRIDEFHVGGDGTVLLLRFGDVLQWKAGAWNALDIAVPDIADLDTATVTTRRDGTLAIFRRSNGALAFQRPEGSVSEVILEHATSAGSVASDSAGRFWVATNAGLFVVRADLTAVARWFPRGAIATLQPSAVDSDYGLKSILVEGAAVELPKAVEPKGWVRGVLTKDGQPLAGVNVELCEEPLRGSLGSMGSPCEGPEVGTVARFDRTADDGSFLFFDVPHDRLFELTADVGDHWFVTADWPCCEEMPASGIHDLGSIAYKSGRKYRTR